jgi:hypothetical protein
MAFSSPAPTAWKCNYPNGEEIHRISYEAIRPTLDALKPRWRALIEGKDGFYPRRQGLGIGHPCPQGRGKGRIAGFGVGGKNAYRGTSRRTSAKDPQLPFPRGGTQPRGQGHALRYLFENYHWEVAVPIYIGDDDKDEEAFQAINERDGYSILVSKEPRETQAKYSLDSPVEVHEWLREAVIL